MTTATDTQAVWDTETAQHTRKLLKKLAAKVRQAQEKEAAAKGEAKETRKASRTAHEKLATFIELDSDKDDLEYIRHLQTLTVAAESARDEEDQARKCWVAAVVARRKAQDDLRVAVRRQMEPLPLFDRPPTNGHREPPPIERVPNEIICTPTEEQIQARDYAAQGRLIVEIGGNYLYVTWDEPRGIFEAEARTGFGNWSEDVDEPQPGKVQIAERIGARLGVAVEITGVGMDLKGRPTFALRRVPRMPTPEPSPQLATPPQPPLNLTHKPDA